MKIVFNWIVDGNSTLDWITKCSFWFCCQVQFRTWFHLGGARGVQLLFRRQLDLDRHWIEFRSGFAFSNEFDRVSNRKSEMFGFELERSNWNCGYARRSSFVLTGQSKSERFSIDFRAEFVLNNDGNGVYERDLGGERRLLTCVCLICARRFSFVSLYVWSVTNPRRSRWPMIDVTDVHNRLSAFLSFRMRSFEFQSIFGWDSGFRIPPSRQELTGGFSFEFCQVICNIFETIGQFRMDCFKWVTIPAVNRRNPESGTLKADACIFLQSFTTAIN